jgi:lipoyl synthase
VLERAESKQCSERAPLRKPAWLKVRAPSGERYTELRSILHRHSLHTVCESARCPNLGGCWASGTATMMILGDVCTRGCRFCAVRSGHPGGTVESDEPVRVARAVAEMGLKYVVLTMVDRDDLPDGGASHVARTVGAIREANPATLVETLVGDFAGKRDDIDVVLSASPDVFAHNIEVVREMTPRLRDRRCSYQRSLDVLRYARERGECRYVKSSVMVGVGETDEQLRQTLVELRDAGVQIVTIGQYLQPSPKHHPVERFVSLEGFLCYERWSEDLGFLCVASGPLVRSSYHAAEVFVAASRPAGKTAGPA